MSRFDHDIYHRDDDVLKRHQWQGDHASTGPNDLCGPPEEKRTINRGSRSSDFNTEWIYRCVPGGNLGMAHMMTSIGDTSGYSIGGFSPKQSFQNIREIRWDVNITSLGNRQFTEVKVMPVSKFDFQNLPCALKWLPCNTDLHSDLGSVGVSFFNREMSLHNGVDNQGYTPGRWNDRYRDDPALQSVRIRRTMIFRDNGNGTLSYSVQKEDGSFVTQTRSGRFPSGPVRVVFADHNYTPEKDNDPIGFTWHWDNIVIAG